MFFLHHIQRTAHIDDGLPDPATSLPAFRPVLSEDWDVVLPIRSGGALKVEMFLGSARTQTLTLRQGPTQIFSCCLVIILADKI